MHTNNLEIVIIILSHQACQDGLIGERLALMSTSSVISRWHSLSVGFMLKKIMIW